MVLDTYNAWGNLLSSSGSISQVYEYVGREGYYREVVFNLYLLGQKWYDSSVGRFISRDQILNLLNRDTFLITELSKIPFNFQFYLYCKNNPIKNIDPMGLTGKNNESIRLQLCQKMYEEQLNLCKILYGDTHQNVPTPNPDYILCIGQATANKKDCDEWACTRYGPPGPYRREIQIDWPRWLHLIPWVDYIPWRIFFH